MNDAVLVIDVTYYDADMLVDQLNNSLPAGGPGATFKVLGMPDGSKKLHIYSAVAKPTEGAPTDE